MSNDEIILLFKYIRTLPVLDFARKTLIKHTYFEVKSEKNKTIILNY